MLSTRTTDPPGPPAASTALNSYVRVALAATWFGCAVLVASVVKGVPLILLTCVFVALSIGFVYRSTNDVFAPPVFGGLLFLLYFPVRALLLVFDTRGVTYPFLLTSTRTQVEATAQLVLFAWLAWTAGYALAPARGAIKSAGARFGFGSSRFSHGAVTTLCIVGILVRVAVFAGGNSSVGSTISTSSASFINAIDGLAYLAVAVAMIEWCEKRWSSMSVAILASLNFLSAGLGSSKGNVAIAALSVLLPYHYHRRPFRFRAVLVWLLLVALILMPVGVAYRNALARPGEGGTLATTTTALKADLSGGVVGFVQQSARATSSRLSGIEAVAAARRLSPSQIPFTSPRIYLLIVPSLIVPKALWSGKPNFEVKDFAARYLDLPPHAISGVTTTPIADLWLHGGWVPLVLGMAVLGMMARWLYELASASGMARYRGAVWLALLFCAVTWDLGFANNVARAGRAVTLLFASLAALGFVITRSSSVQGKHSPGQTAAGGGSGLCE